MYWYLSTTSRILANSSSRLSDHTSIIWLRCNSIIIIQLLLLLFRLLLLLLLINADVAVSRPPSGRDDRNIPSPPSPPLSDGCPGKKFRLIAVGTADEALRSLCCCWENSDVVPIEDELSMLSNLHADADNGDETNDDPPLGTRILLELWWWLLRWGGCSDCSRDCSIDLLLLVVVIVLWWYGKLYMLLANDE